MNTFQFVLTSEGLALALDSSDSFLNLEVELSKNRVSASLKVGRVRSGLEGSVIGSNSSGMGSDGSGTERVFLESVVA